MIVNILVRIRDGQLRHKTFVIHLSKYLAKSADYPYNRYKCSERSSCNDWEELERRGVEISTRAISHRIPKYPKLSERLFYLRGSFSASPDDGKLSLLLIDPIIMKHRQFIRTRILFKHKLYFVFCSFVFSRRHSWNVSRAAGNLFI